MNDQPHAAENPPRVLIGGVGYRWMSDASFGVVASDQLAKMDWPQDVTVDDLGYGALLVSQDLSMAEPPYSRLILIGAVERGRKPGLLYRNIWQGNLPDAEVILERIREAGAGVIDVDHLLIIAQQQGTLPREVIVYEVEPVDRSPSVDLGPTTAGLLPELIKNVWRDALAPLTARTELPE